MAGREDYEEHRQARIDHMKDRAEKATARSSEYGAEFDRMMEAIPFGQPIITGRGSRTTADINYRARAGRKLDHAVAEQDKAAYYTDRAAAAESNTAISSDDPDALRRLRDKLEQLEAARDEIKAENVQRHKTGEELHPAWMLSNLGAEIRRVKGRIAQLERLDTVEPEPDIAFPGGRIHDDTEFNRTQVLFDNIPESEIRQRLKSWGFRWSPRAHAWQRLRSPAARRAARYALKV